MRHLPNLICVLRIVLIWPIVVSLEQGAYPRTLLLFFIAALSDGLDGFLAKRYHWTSELGKILDPLGDKLLLVAVFLVATWYGLIPRSLTIVAVARDVMIGLGALVYRIGWGPLHGRPMISSKINTLVQLLYVLAVIANAGFQLPPPGVARALGLLTFATLLISGFLYAREFTRRALALAHA
ncbi:MAG TPA: CDP-alcohol phosphatidyltransferase family protein [Steroidobacteraceae bacterium]|nr:CDP-alcohol phosphatidyltransferase family protein [Steroidobacteraceae bacterium]